MIINSYYSMHLDVECSLLLLQQCRERLRPKDESFPESVKARAMYTTGLTLLFIQSFEYRIHIWDPSLAAVLLDSVPSVTIEVDLKSERPYCIRG